MKVYGLLSWYDEEPAHLTRCIESLAPLVDHIVAVDGAYAAYPDAHAASPVDQWLAIQCAAIRCDLPCDVFTPDQPWQGGEVEKRAAMFQHARDCGATPDDWLLVIDADCLLAKVDPMTRTALRETDCAVAEVRTHNVRPDDHLMDDFTFRPLFRALPGLTCRGIHCVYAAPVDGGWRYLWHLPSCRVNEAEPVLDLTGHVTMHHRRLDRSGDRDKAAREYYRERERLDLERSPSW
jgi:hypothetical protein